MISYYMTVRNGMPFVLEAIQSVVDQDVPDWELVIVDDGSTDGTPDAILEHHDRNPQIRLIRSRPIGRATALNLAVSHCRYEIISNIDADDFIHPAKTRIFEQVFSNEDIAHAYCSSFVFQKSSELAALKSSKPTFTPPRQVTSNLPGKSFIDHSATAMRKRDFYEVGLYNEARKTQIDYDLWYRWALSGRSVHKIDETLSAKRRHKNQNFEARKRAKYLSSAFILKSRYIIQSKSNYLYLILAVMSFLYGFLPLWARALTKGALRRRAAPSQI